MKQKDTKILIILIAIILIAGMIVIFAKGLKFELKYQNAQKVELNIGKQFEKIDVQEIAEKIFDKNPVKIDKIEIYEDTASVMTTQITEEQKQELVTKINEKYGTEISADDVKIEEVIHTRGRDIIKPYLAPFAIATVIIFIYLFIRYYKLNSFEVLIQSIGIIVLAQLVLLGIMAITRMPIGKFTIPAVLLVYMFSTYICTAKFEQDLKQKMLKENKR